MNHNPFNTSKRAVLALMLVSMLGLAGCSNTEATPAATPAATATAVSAAGDADTEKPAEKEKPTSMPAVEPEAPAEIDGVEFKRPSYKVSEEDEKNVYAYAMNLISKLRETENANGWDHIIDDYVKDTPKPLNESYTNAKLEHPEQIDENDLDYVFSLNEEYNLHVTPFGVNLSKK